MQLNRLFKFFSLLFIIWGDISLFLTGFLQFYFFIPLLILSFLLYFNIGIKIPTKSGVVHTDGQNKADRLYSFFNILALLSFLFFFFNFIFAAGGLLENSIGLLLLLKGIKSITLRKHSEYLILFLLSFFEIIAATVISDDLYFVFILVGFLLIATFSLILFNFINELEVKSKVSRHEGISTRFFLFIVPLTISISLITLFIFYLFPRIDFGFFYRDNKRGVMVSGFDENVKLGSIGKIQENKEVVMRVEMEKNPYAEKMGSLLYFRGSAFDLYDGENWKRMVAVKRIIRADDGYSITLRNIKENKKLVKQNIYLAPLNTRIIFGLETIYKIEFPKLKEIYAPDSSIEYDLYGTIYFRDERGERNYAVYSDLALLPLSLLINDSTTYPSDIESRYLSIPKTNEAIYTLSHSIADKSNTIVEKVLSIEKHLRSSGNYKYTLELKESSREDHISDFLLFTKRGNCEYFASSMVILLRMVGIPSRVVSGFYGGEWNEVGKYLIVRQNNAHTWVEVFFPSYGWQRFDPTPATDTGNNQVGRLTVKNYFFHYMDYARLRWYKYVIQYSLRDQIKIFSKVTGINPDTDLFIKFYQASQNFKKRLSRWGIWENFTLAAIIISFVIFILKKVLLQRPRRIRTKKSENELYNLLINFLKKRKVYKQDTETLYELMARLPQTIPIPQKNILNKIVYYYYKMRFGKCVINNLENLEINELKSKLFTFQSYYF